MKAPTYTRDNAFCPQCGSHERHRALVKYIESNIDLTGLAVLDIAPVRSFRSYFTKGGAHYVSADLFAPAMVKCNILDAPFPDEVFDCIVCYHVLEHIKDDVAAMREIRRMLKPNGLALIQAPFDPTKEKTTEYDAPDSLSHDHVRSHYGRDLKDRVVAAGFRFESHDLGKLFPEKVRKKHGFDKESGITFLCRR
jgi:SAM-dependent methyltransferase